MSPVTCNATVNCSIAISFFCNMSSQYFTILMSPKMRKKQTMPESRACKPVCFSMSSNSFWSKMRTKVHVVAISFPSFNGKTLHRKAVEITLAWRENDLFFCLPHIFTEHLRLTRCVNLRENPPYIDSELTRCKLDPISDSKPYEVL